jgi:prevent-host-death family protein
MSTASVEEFQKNAAAFLAAAEKGEPVIIARGRKPVARLLPMEENNGAEAEYESWRLAGSQNLARAYGPDEPVYTPEMIIEPNPHYRP